LGVFPDGAAVAGAADETAGAWVAGATDFAGAEVGGVDED